VVTIIGRSVRGLEWVAADEVSATLPEARGLAMAGREVTFTVAELAPPLLGLRTVDDVFAEVGRVAGAGPGKDSVAAVARGVGGLDWSTALARLGQVRSLPARPAIDVVVSLAGRRGYNRFAVEHAAGETLARRLGGAYLPRTSGGRPAGRPDLVVRVFVRGTEAVAAVRLAADPLHRRGYKRDAGAGTLHPPAAAALARLAAPAAGTAADPMCGDGTIAIETALSCPGTRVLASDIDPGRLGAAGRNAARAGARLAVCRADAGRLPWAGGSVEALITNPPWQVAVEARGRLRGSLGEFWRDVPRVLTPGGRLCLIADAQLGTPGLLPRLGYQLALAAQVRLAGRVSHVLLCAPPGRDPVCLPDGLARWRHRALAAGVVTETGF
jgi:tRNA (guanine6-N2)-methyltransferase